MPVISAGQRAALRGQNRLIRTGAAGAAPPPDPLDPAAPPVEAGAAPAGPQMSTPNTNIRPNPAGTRPGAGSVSPVPIDPVDVVAGNPRNEWQQFEDDAYTAQTRRMDPQFEQQRATLEQQLINRGLQPGTAAYSAAIGDFEQGRNDAYAGARAQARQQGVSAQQQAFDQAYRESALANALLTAREGNRTSLDIAGMNANNASNAAEIGRLNFLDQLGFNREQLGDDRQRWDQNFGFQQGQWNDQFGLQSGQADFQNMLGLMDRDFSQQQFNAGLGQQDYNNMLQLFGMTPQGGPAQIDAMTPYQMQQQGQQANYNAQQQNYAQQQQQNNGMWSALGGIGSAFLLCDRAAKAHAGPADPADCTARLRRIPLAEFSYHADVTARPFVGVYAQDFGNAVHGEPATNIRLLDAFGLLMGCMKDLDRRLLAIENRQDPAAYQSVSTTETEH